MYFLTTEKALHMFTLPTKFRGGYAALNQARKPKVFKNKKEEGRNAKNVSCTKCTQN